MDKELNSKNERLYAKYYSSLPAHSGTRRICVRDVPNLIKNYVTGKDALDYGCGAGHSTLLVKEQGFQVDGVDVNEDMVRLAKLNDPTGVYKVIKSGEVPTPDQRYDFVFSCLVLMHANTKGELHKIVREMYRVLKPEGTLIVIANNINAYNEDWYSLDTRFPENMHLVSGSMTKIKLKENGFVIYCCYWSEEDYVEAMTKAGFTVVLKFSPLGLESDGIPWTTEYEKSYVTTYVAKKCV